MGGINVRGVTLGSVGGSRRGHLSFVGQWWSCDGHVGSRRDQWGH